MTRNQNNVFLKCVYIIYTNNPTIDREHYKYIINNTNIYD